jgi:hypothetical protein
MEQRLAIEGSDVALAMNDTVGVSLGVGAGRSAGARP